MKALPLILAGFAAACSPAEQTVESPVPTEVAQTTRAPPATPAEALPRPPDEPLAVDPGPTPPPPTPDPEPRGVTVRADPPPPFTYWAPPGSVIRNHGNPGLWVAVLNGRQVKTYFGDDCGASRLQGWIGLREDELPALPPVLPQRNFAQGQPVTQDLVPNRINVIYDPQTRRVVEVACF